MILTATSFATITEYVLREGDRMTYCNMYNDNPHLAVGDVDLFLHPDIGQRNINCDPEASGWDEIVFRQEVGGSTQHTSIRLNDESPVFADSDRAALEYYFALLIAEISKHTG